MLNSSVVAVLSVDTRQDRGEKERRIRRRSIEMRRAVPSLRIEAEVEETAWGGTGVGEHIREGRRQAQRRGGEHDEAAEERS